MFSIDVVFVIYNLSRSVVQSFLKAGTEIEAGVLEVVYSDHLCRISVHLAFQRATVGGVDPVLDDGAVFEVNEEVPAFDICGFLGVADGDFFGTDIIVGEVVLVYFVGEGIERGEAFAKRLKLPVNVVSPTLCVGTVVPVLSGFDVPETVDALSVVVGLVVAVFHIGFVELAALVVDSDEVVIGWRSECIGACEGLCGRFYWFFDNDGNFVWIEYDEMGYRFSVVVLTGGGDATVANGFGNYLDFFAEVERLETDDFWTFYIVTDAVAVFKRHPNDGVANGYFEFGLVRLLSRHKAREAENHKCKQRFFHY